MQVSAELRKTHRLERERDNCVATEVVLNTDDLLCCLLTPNEPLDVILLMSLC